ncbi:MAG TPA: roadblock/LC7 domain-containing protein [Xanthomonadaceae bacterium]|nr:roadblock/LC7 domain-containing protein [Xanthomonadaceae bacterium]
MPVNTPDRTRSAAALDRLLQGCDGVQAAMFALRDGRPFVEKSRTKVEGGKLAAMTSSLVALGKSVLRELKAGELDHVLIEGSTGKLVVSSVPDSGGLLILAVLASSDARLGLVLGHSKMCAQAVAAASQDGAARSA